MREWAERCRVNINRDHDGAGFGKSLGGGGTDALAGTGHDCHLIL